MALHRPRGVRLLAAAVRRRAAEPPTSTRCPRRSSPPTGDDRRAGGPADPAQLRGHGHASRARARSASACGSATSTVAAAERPELVEPYLHTLVSDRPVEVHGAARGVPDRRHAPVRPQGCPRSSCRSRRSPTWTPTARRSSRAPCSIADVGSEVTFIDRYVSPKLERALSDAVVEIVAHDGARVRYIALQEYGEGVQHLSVQRAHVGRDAEVRSLGVAFGATLDRAEADTVLLGDGGTSEMLGVYFGDGDQHIDHRSVQDHVGSRTSSDLLYKGALRDRSNAIFTGHRDPRARRARVRRVPDEPQHPAVGDREGDVGPEPRDPDERSDPMRSRRQRRAGQRRRALLPDEPRDLPRGGRAADRVRVLRRGPRPGRAVRGPRLAGRVDRGRARRDRHPGVA